MTTDQYKNSGAAPIVPHSANPHSKVQGTESWTAAVNANVKRAAQWNDRPCCDPAWA